MISDRSKECIRAVMILEAIGRPPEHLTETLEGLVKQMNEEKGVEVAEKKVNEAVEIKNQKGFYTSFAEVEVEVEDILYLAVLMFKYMPAHIEIISPESINLTNNGLNDIFNELVRRLHSYDEVAGVLQMEKQILENKLREILGQKAEAAKQEIKEETKPEVKKKKGRKITHPSDAELKK